MQDTNTTVGRNVARFRERRMSQAQLAEELAARLGKERVDPTTITRLEQGKRPITVNELTALAEILQVSEAVLLSSSEANLAIATARTRATAIRRLSAAILVQAEDVAEEVSGLRRMLTHDPTLRSHLDEWDLRRIDALWNVQTAEDALRAIAGREADAEPS